MTIALMLVVGCAATTRDLSSRQAAMTGIAVVESAVGEERTPSMLGDDATLDDYLAWAALHNPRLEAAFNRWKASLERIPQVRALPDPRFTYAYYIENVETRVGPQRHRFELSQVFPWFGKLDLKGDIALEDAKIRQLDYEKQKNELFFKVTDVYCDYYFLSQSIRVTEENLELLGYFEQIARTRYETGDADYADLVTAQVELGRLEERLLSLEYFREPVAARLNELLARPTDAPLPWPTDIPDDDIPLDDDEIIRRIRISNPELQALWHAVEKGATAVDLARKQFYPDIMLGVSYIETGPSPMANISGSGTDPVMTMLSMNLPIWRDTYRAGVREAELSRDSSARERDNRENMLLTEVTTALYQFRDAGRKTTLFRDTLIPKARQALNVTRTAFEAGNTDFLSLIDNQRTLLELELAAEQALVTRAKQHARIEMIAGGDL